MARLIVSIEKNGVQMEVGYIDYSSVSDACFSYAENFLKSSEPFPISLSLPLQTEIFTAAQTRCFFEGLLPEGFTRRSVAQHLRFDENDYVSILAALGTECLGAIRILKENAPAPEPTYELLETSQIKKLAEEGADTSAELAARAHLSLTGASGKVGLYLDSSSGKWYLPRGCAPSTHIVKQSHVRLERIVTNEQLCLLTAKKLGIDIPESFIVNVGSGRDEDVLFATRRYDREFGEKIHTVGGLPIPLRLHQEDFAQAMGIASSDKYEKSGEDYLQKMFAVLEARSEDPLEDSLRLWDMMIFDYLVGNADNHIKNHSLLYSSNLKTVRLAPAYDIISTAVYESSSREMGIAIGGKLSMDDIDRSSFEEEAHKVGLSVKVAMTRFDRMQDAFEAAIDEAAGELSESGFGKAAELAEAIKGIH